MESRKILEKIIDLKSIYGVGARTHLDDPVLGHQFILECYDHIKENRESMELHFGLDVVHEIVLYVEQKKA